MRALVDPLGVSIRSAAVTFANPPATSTLYSPDTTLAHTQYPSNTP
jgi:hypothetical protein